MLQIVLFVALGLLLLYVALRVIMFLVAFFTLYSEPRYAYFLEPIDEAEAPPRSDYGNAMTAAAAEAGFTPCGTYIIDADVDSGARAELWLSPDRTVAAMIEAGPIDRLPYRRTNVYTQFEDGSRVTSTDTPDEGDLLGVRGWRVLLDADFEHLLDFHRQRMQAAPATPRVFDPAVLLKQIEHLAHERADKLRAARLIRYRDEEGRAWNYTLRGAFRVYFSARLQELNDLKEQERLQRLTPQPAERE